MPSIQSFRRETIATGRQRKVAAPALHPRVHGRAGGRGQILAMTVISLIAVRASVAGVQDLPNCIYALSPTGTGLSISGSGSTLSAACGIVVDSSAASALDAGSGAVFGTTVAVTGGISGSCSTTDPAGCQTGIPPQPDPFATRADPQFSGCDFGVLNVSGGVVTLNP